jgi:hypothetical protein
VANASTDILGAKLLEQKALSWSAVERAIPIIRSSGKTGTHTLLILYSYCTFTVLIL